MLARLTHDKWKLMNPRPVKCKNMHDMHIFKTTETTALQKHKISRQWLNSCNDLLCSDRNEFCIFPRHEPVLRCHIDRHLSIKRWELTSSRRGGGDSQLCILCLFYQQETCTLLIFWRWWQSFVDEEWKYIVWCKFTF